MDEVTAHFFLIDEYQNSYGLYTSSSSKNAMRMVELPYRANPAYGSALEKSLDDFIMYGVGEVAKITFDEYCNKTTHEVNILNRRCKVEYERRNSVNKGVVDGLEKLSHERPTRQPSSVGVTKP